MLRHAIAPPSGWTKAPHTLVRSRRMNSDAKILLLYVQGLPDSATDHPLGELARKLDMKGRSYQQAKKQLTEHGYLHEWRSQGDGGRWMTEQLLSSTPLTRDEAGSVRAKLSPEAGQLDRPEQPPCPRPPSAQSPTVGEPTTWPVGGYEPEEEHDEENSPPNPPSEPKPKPTPEPEAAPAQTPAPAPAPAPESDGGPDPEATPTPRSLARAERVLLSLRHSRRELLLGVGEARALAGKAARWLERGVTESDLRHALLAEPPKEGVRSAFGFLGHRLTHKCPVPAAPAAPPEPPPPPVRALIVCTGTGTDAEEHLFRPLGDETECAECRRATAYASWMVDTDTYDFPADMTWRQRVVAVAKADALRGKPA
ncbi:hypothetical protein AB0C45_00735 [Streptomyces cyaneofuscatus]|uniref:hypothetical protein n=1 Tax=Streptomyces cyaneofuscatus TaxID=66883 RepID=UPI00340F5912